MLPHTIQSIRNSNEPIPRIREQHRILRRLERHSIRGRIANQQRADDKPKRMLRDSNGRRMRLNRGGHDMGLHGKQDGSIRTTRIINPNNNSTQNKLLELPDLRKRNSMRTNDRKRGRLMRNGEREPNLPRSNAARRVHRVPKRSGRVHKHRGNRNRRANDEQRNAGTTSGASRGRNEQHNGQQRNQLLHTHNGIKLQHSSAKLIYGTKRRKRRKRDSGNRNNKRNRNQRNRGHRRSNTERSERGLRRKRKQRELRNNGEPLPERKLELR